MDNENKKEFSSKYILDYKMYKEFSRGYLSVSKASIILWVLLAIALILNIIEQNYKNVILFGIVYIIFGFIYIIVGRNKFYYKRSKFLNNDKDIDATVKIDEEKIVLTSQNGNTTNYTFDQITSIIETNNLLILKLKYNVGIIIDKNNLTGGTKEELTNYLFSVCKNIKKQKVINSKYWIILRKIISIIYVILFILSIVLFSLKKNEMSVYQNVLEQNDYYVELQTEVYNGYNTKQLIITKNYEHVNAYMYEFGTDKDAKNNIKYWANLEADSNIKDEYIIEDSRDYQKYVIDNIEKYIILIRKDNYVFYGIGNLEYKDELNNIVNIIEKEMKEK